MKKLTLMMVLALAIAGLSATSATAGLNFGASFTDTTTDGGSFSDFDADDSSYKLFAGWRFSGLKWLGIEGQYSDFGEFDDTVTGTPVATESTGLSVYAVGSIKVWRLDLFAKAGVVWWDNEVNAGGGSDEDGTDPAYGLGAAFRITERIWIRGEYEILEVDDADVDVASLGIDIRF